MRLSTDQNFVLTGISDDALQPLMDEPLVQRYSPNPGPFSRGVVACTGSEFCRYAIVETKVNAVRFAAELDARFAKAIETAPGLARDDEVIRLHFSGCPASCAQPQIADVGLRGETAHRGDEIVEAVDVSLGGSLGADGSFGRWVVGALPVDELVGTVSSMVESYLAERRDEEPFHEWARRRGSEEVASSALAARAGDVR